MVSSCKDLVALLHGSCGKEPGMTCGGALGAQELEGTPGTLLQGWVGWRRVLAVGGSLGQRVWEERGAPPAHGGIRPTWELGSSPHRLDCPCT